MTEVLGKYGGWPVVQDDQWNFEDWDWLKTTIEMVNDGLIDLILACHIEVNPQNTSEHILVVSHTVNSNFSPNQNLICIHL